MNGSTPASQVSTTEDWSSWEYVRDKYVATLNEDPPNSVVGDDVVQYGHGVGIVDFGNFGTDLPSEN
jgi:hypothetical protein